MAKVEVYTPRKVTPQNEASLPSTHDQSKRISYMQIQLEEPEIAEAIRNYIRQQVPVIAGDEMPVVLTAGRGDNGHTATITIQPSTPVVTGAERPTDAFDTFDAANAAASAQNAKVLAAEKPVESQTASSDEVIETPTETPETAPVATPTTEIAPEDPTTDRIETTVVETAPTQAEEEAPWVESEEDNPGGINDPTPEPVAEDPKLAAPKSIFDDVTDERDETPSEAPTTRKASSLFGSKVSAPATPTEEKIPETAVKPKSKSIFENF